MVRDRHGFALGRQAGARLDRAPHTSALRLPQGRTTRLAARSRGAVRADRRHSPASRAQDAPPLGGSAVLLSVLVGGGEAGRVDSEVLLAARLEVEEKAKQGAEITVKLTSVITQL